MNDGIVLLNKESGVTSFRALNPLKRVLGKKTKVGHTGTLDQFAEGLMVILCGSLTRLNSYFSNLDKEYEAVIIFGSETDSLDPNGSITKKSALPSLSLLKDVLQQFIGSQQQIPPVYSAIHIDGKRASDRTREGQVVEMESRAVIFYDLNIIGYSLENNLLSELKLNIACSKGTYIRSFARDLAARMGSCGHLSKLKRTGIGYYQENRAWLYSISDAVKSIEFDPKVNLLKPHMLDHILKDCSISYVKNCHVHAVSQGVVLDEQWLLKPVTTGYSLLLETDGTFIAFIRKRGGGISYQFVRSSE